MIPLVTVSPVTEFGAPGYAHTLTVDISKHRRFGFDFDPRDCYSITETFQRKEVFCENALTTTSDSDFKSDNLFQIEQAKDIIMTANKFFSGAQPLQGKALEALELAFFDSFKEV